MEALRKEYGFRVALAATMIVAMLLEFSGMWITMIVAGFIGGFLTKRLLRGIIVGFFGVLIGWTLYFVAFWTLSLHGFSVAFELIPTFVFLTMTLGGILGCLGGAIGSLTSMIVFPLKARSQHRR